MSTPEIRSLPVDPYFPNLLGNIEEGKTVLALPKDTQVFSQGEEGQALYFIWSGQVKLTAFSVLGQEAVLAVLGPRDFLGAGCLAGESVRMTSAITTRPSIIFRVERQSMLRSLHEQPDLAAKFILALLGRQLDLEEDLCDQLLNPTEKRLARALVKLNRFGPQDGASGAEASGLSHEILAEMIGATRSRVTHFMNKFRKMGLIHYAGAARPSVRVKLLTQVVLDN